MRLECCAKDECCVWEVERPFIEGMTFGSEGTCVSLQEISVPHTALSDLFIHGMAHAAENFNAWQVWTAIQATLIPGCIEV